jgi:hypothetical protein
MEPIKISRDGVYKLIKNINPSKATGPDTIAGRVLKENIDICTDILTLLFTKSLKTGKVPSDAFSDGFECRVPSLRRGAMPVFSFFWHFMKE